MPDVAQILRTLLDPKGPPRTIADLEAAVGVRFDEKCVFGNEFGSFNAPSPLASGPTPPPLNDDIVSVSAKYHWDMHHQRPPATIDQLREQSVVDLTVQFARGRGPIEAELRERFGAPRAVPNHRAYDLWFVSAYEGEGDACSLSHYEKLPDWAVDAPDAAVRAKFLLELAVAARAAADVADIVKATSSPPARSGIAYTGNGSRASFEVTPPIGAIELVRILGIPIAIGQTNDVNMSNWRIMVVTGQGEWGPVTAPPTLGRWNVYALLQGRPTGGDVAGDRGGPTARQRLGAADLVRVLSVGTD